MLSGGYVFCFFSAVTLSGIQGQAGPKLRHQSLEGHSTILSGLYQLPQSEWLHVWKSLTVGWVLNWGYDCLTFVGTTPLLLWQSELMVFSFFPNHASYDQHRSHVEVVSLAGHYLDWLPGYASPSRVCAFDET